MKNDPGPGEYELVDIRQQQMIGESILITMFTMLVAF